MVGLIVTDEETSALKTLFNDKQIITMIEMLYKNNQNNEYSDYYNNNKSNFYKIFKKYLRMNGADKLIIDKIKKILNDKFYKFNGNLCKSIAEVLELIFNELLNNSDKTLEEIYDLVNIYSDFDPLLVLKEDVLKTDHPKWHNRIREYQGKKYYILSLWRYSEYEEFKVKFKQLKEDNPDVYGNITLE